MAEAKIVALVMAGGSGTRFWPQSRAERPKQYLKLVGDKSLLASTLARVRPLVAPDATYICSAKSQAGLLQEHAPEVTRLLLEPEGKNTAACLMLSLARMQRDGLPPSTTMIVLPADHYISDEDVFRSLLELSCRFARESGGLITMGIVPDSPHTGYGYIEAGEPAHGATKIKRVKHFIEKPDAGRAKRFLESGNFLWNSGVFIWTLGALHEAFLRHTPAAWQAISSHRDEADLARIYSGLESTPIDIAVLEKADNVFVVPAEMGWSDIGSWNALYRLHAPSGDRNVALSGEVRGRESGGNLVQVPEGRKVALVGVHDLIIVESEGTLLIANRHQDQLVRQIAADFEKK